jgi:hypothetical protein
MIGSYPLREIRNQNRQCGGSGPTGLALAVKNLMNRTLGLELHALRVSDHRDLHADFAALAQLRVHGPGIGGDCSPKAAYPSTPVPASVQISQARFAV